MECVRNANGMRSERKWSAFGTQMERVRNANGTHSKCKWNAFGTQMECERSVRLSFFEKIQHFFQNFGVKILIKSVLRTLEIAFPRP